MNLLGVSLLLWYATCLVRAFVLCDDGDEAACRLQSLSKDDECTQDCAAQFLQLPRNGDGDMGFKPSTSDHAWVEAVPSQNTSSRFVSGSYEPLPLNTASIAPLLTFYAYRAVSGENYPQVNVNAGNLAGVMWYLHHEVVIQAPRKFDIQRILRFKVSMRATQPLADLGMNFGSRLAFDRGQATGPFSCGRNVASAEVRPDFCGSQWASGLLPTQAPFEWSKYGYHVGCNKLGEWPFPTSPVYYPGAVWYSFPGSCPSSQFGRKSPGCANTDPGGYCPGKVPDGSRACTWNYELAGSISIDELVGIRDYNSFINSGLRGPREYDPSKDRGMRFNWWDGINDPTRNSRRVEAALSLFRAKFPHSTPASQLPEPTCDFNFNAFFQDWFPKAGPCQDATPNTTCRTEVEWAMGEGIHTHADWYPGLTAKSSFQAFQRLLYRNSQGDCAKPCTE